MRIWSIHPAYLDTKGLTALWIETLLAKYVLSGKTKGYKKHPQLLRFQNTEHPIDYLNMYLSEVYKEAVKRGFVFDKDKFSLLVEPLKLPVTIRQIEYEKQHLLKKLESRDRHKYEELLYQKEIVTHPLFYRINGEVEEWKVKK